MPQLQIFDKLVALPLFMGMSRAELNQTIEKTKFEFHKASKGQVVVSEGERSGQLLLLIDGELEITTSADDHSYSLIERVKAPFSIQPEQTFGLTQRYSATFTALTQCSLISISKSETLRLIGDSLIFRLNMLNNLSTSLQRQLHTPWRCLPTTLQQRIITFLASHCSRPAGHKTFLISKKRLASELGEHRNNIALELSRLEAQGLIKQGRKRIDIPAIELLLGLSQG